MSLVLGPQELKNQKTGRTISIVLHVLLFLILLIRGLEYKVPPEGQSGVLVSFGEPNQGRNDDRAAAAPVQEEVAEEEPEEAAKPVEEIKPEPVKPKPKPTPAKNSITDERSKEIAIAKKKKKEREDKLRKEQAEDQARKDAIEERKQAVERKKRKAENAKRKAEAERKRKQEADAQALKDGIAGAFGGGQGSGNGDRDGDQGQPNGDPDGKALDGISTGAGELGGGLGNRGLLSRPKIPNNSQKTGTVVVKVCVNASGNVSSANYTQSGSSTNDAGLIAIAESSARKYKFTKGTSDRQCGTIRIIFKLK